MMAYNYDISKGKYPDEKGYHEWTGFEPECKIKGSTPDKYIPIQPLKFQKKLLDMLKLDMRSGHCYTDFKIRCHIELEKNKRYFQPKEWGVDKLLYNYDLLFHSVNNSAILYETLIEALHDHIKGLYEDYNVEPRHKLPNSILHAQKRSFYIEK
jgi:hypothetical protein|tara:strand:+ start:129 stop:590 length:462 start_codon:yes stop_codon:yes gene_type:complete